MSWYDDPNRILPAHRQLTGDQREWLRDVKQRNRWYPKAFEVGLEGYEWQPELWGWPPGDDIYQAYLSGCDERRRRRLNDRIAHALVWLARKLAPKTTELAGRARDWWQDWWEGRDR
jgi:hypothetical protein